MIAVCVSSPALSDHGPGLWLAGTAGSQPGVQGRGDHDAPSRGDGAAASGRPARAGLGRPGGPGGARPAAASGAARPPARHAGHVTGLAPPPDHTEVDVPEPAGPPADQPGDPRPGAAAGAREPGLGVPPGARRAVSARSSGQRGDRAADLARPAQTGPAETGHLVAGVPAHSGAWAAGLRLLPCRHDLPPAPVCPVRDAGSDPARARPRSDRPPGQLLDRPAGPQPAYGHRRPDRLLPLPHPGPGCQVHPCLRQDLRQRGRESSKDPAADTTGELLCRERDGYAQREPSAPTGC